MEIQNVELNNGIGVIKLKGKLDIVGAGEIGIKFAAYCSGENNRIIVDLSEVSFLASIGIQTLVVNAKSLASRNGKMVLLNPSEEVHAVLEMTGISAIIPIYNMLETAEAFLLAS